MSRNILRDKALCQYKGGVASNDQIKECGLLTFTLLFYKMLQNEQFLLFASPIHLSI